jgi:hypothetical protein
MTTRSYQVRDRLGNTGRFLKDLASKSFELTSREDSTGVTGHISDLVDDENNIALWCSDDTTSGHQSEIANRMVVNATEINGAVSSGDDTHVASGNTTVGTTVDEGGPINTRGTEGTSVDTDGDGVSATLVQSGGR